MRQNLVLPGLMVAGILAASSAAAMECSEQQEQLAGKQIATTANTKISGLVPGAGKQMFNINTCDVAGGTVIIDFKYNVIGEDGLYWIAGVAKVSGGAIGEFRIKSMSANMQAASTKQGVPLASN